jgi:hypothetical protein
MSKDNYPCTLGVDRLGWCKLTLSGSQGRAAWLAGSSLNNWAKLLDNETLIL